MPKRTFMIVIWWKSVPTTLSSVSSGGHGCRASWGLGKVSIVLAIVVPPRCFIVGDARPVWHSLVAASAG
jgi:hypothetical protein